MEQTTNAETLEEKREARRFRNSRRMAWISFFAAMGATLYVFGYMENPQDYSVFYQTFMTFCAAIIGTYIGFTTYDQVNTSRNSMMARNNYQYGGGGYGGNYQSSYTHPGHLDDAKG